MQNLSGASWSNHMNHFSKGLNDTAVAWKDLMNNILLESNVFKQSDINSLKSQNQCSDPTVIMNIRHQMVERTTHFPVPKEVIMTEARKLIRQENATRLAKERESRIIQKEIEEFKKTLENERMSKKSELDKNSSDNKKNQPALKVTKRTVSKVWKRFESYDACWEIDSWFTGGRGPNSTHVRERNTMPNFKVTVKKKESSTTTTESENDKENEESSSALTSNKLDSEVSFPTEIDTIQEMEEEEEEEEKPKCWDESQSNGKNEIMQRFFHSSNEIDRIKYIYNNRIHIKNSKLLAQTNGPINEPDDNYKDLSHFAANSTSIGEKVAEIMGISEFIEEDSETDNEEIPSKYQSKEAENKIDRIKKYLETCNVRYYWETWRKFVHDCKSKKEKVNREEKIETFLKRLMEMKNDNPESNSEAISKSKQRSKNSQSCKAVQKDKVVVKERSKTAPVTLESKFDDQRKKMNKRKRELIIKDMENDETLTKIEQDAKESSKEAHEQLQNTMSCFDPKLRGRIKVLKITSNIGRNRVEKVDAEMQKVFPTPEVLMRMEQRDQERKRRWESIRERKRKIQEEKERLQREKEEEMKQMEENEKKRKLEELREKRRLEKEAEEERRREREKFKKELIIAQAHYNKTLVRNYGMDPWKCLMRYRSLQEDQADIFYRFRILRRVFFEWKTHVQEITELNTNKAEALSRKILQRNYLQLWIESYNESIKQYQVSVDWYDLKLTEKMFRAWTDFVFIEENEYMKKLQISELFYMRKLKVRYLRKWKYYPELLRLERDKEDRKRIWRQKVQEVLPDYRPARISDTI